MRYFSVECCASFSLVHLIYIVVLKIVMMLPTHHMKSLNYWIIPSVLSLHVCARNVKSCACHQQHNFSINHICNKPVNNNSIIIGLSLITCTCYPFGRALDSYRQYLICCLNTCIMHSDVILDVEIICDAATRAELIFAIIENKPRPHLSISRYGRFRRAFYCI